MIYRRIFRSISFGETLFLESAKMSVETKKIANPGEYLDYLFRSESEAVLKGVDFAKAGFVMENSTILDNDGSSID